MHCLIIFMLLGSLLTSQGDINFYVASSRYLDDSGVTWQEIYINVPSSVDNENLQLYLDINDMDNNSRHRMDWELNIPITEESYSLVDKFSFDVDDSVKFVITLKNIELDKSGNVEIITAPLDEMAVVSDILFSSSVSPSTDTGKFVKHGLLLYPAFISDVTVNNPKLLAFYEIYPQLENDSINITAQILDDLGEEIWNFNSILYGEEAGMVVGKLLNLPVGDLSNGSYQFIVDVNGEKRYENFTTLWDISGTMSYLPDLEMSPVAEKYYMNIDMLMTTKQRNFFEALNETGQQEFVKIFWNARDPNPLTPENEELELIATRMEYADDQYSSGFEVGSESDRGRIYIIKGNPEERQIVPADMKFPPNEIWVYWRTGYKYIFADIHRNGKFELIYSNDPDERNHPSWENYTNQTFGDVW